MQTILVRLFIISGFAILISGCSQHQELSTALEDYHERLASVLDTDAVEVKFTASIDFPTKSTLFRQPQAMSFNFREFYSLPNCRLNTLIAERNTGMGKTQLPSQRFIYETDLLSALIECIQISEDETIQNHLNTVLQEKLKQYPNSYANLIQTSDEIALSFSRASGFVSGELSDGLNETQIAWQYLYQLSHFEAQNIAVSSAELEGSLKDLNQFRLIARMWRSQQLIAEWFTTSTPWFVSQTQQLNCNNRSDKQTVDYLNNVFRLFFVEKIQPIASQLNYYHYQLSPTLIPLTSHPDLDPRWQAELKHHLDVRHQNYKSAVRQHIEAWQVLFKRCGISPASN